MVSYFRVSCATDDHNGSIFGWFLGVVNLCSGKPGLSVKIRERPKGGFSLVAATIMRSQELSPIAAVIKTCGRKRIMSATGNYAAREITAARGIAAAREHCGRTGGTGVNQKSKFRPK